MGKNDWAVVAFSPLDRLSHGVAVVAPTVTVAPGAFLKDEGNLTASQGPASRFFFWLNGGNEGAGRFGSPAAFFQQKAFFSPEDVLPPPGGHCERPW